MKAHLALATIHGRRKHFYGSQAIGGIKTLSCSVQGESGELPPPRKNFGILGILRSNLVQFGGLNISCTKH